MSGNDGTRCSALLELEFIANELTEMGRPDYARRRKVRAQLAKDVSRLPSLTERVQRVEAQVQDDEGEAFQEERLMMDGENELTTMGGQSSKRRRKVQKRRAKAVSQLPASSERVQRVEAHALKEERETVQEERCIMHKKNELTKTERQSSKRRRNVQKKIAKAVARLPPLSGRAQRREAHLKEDEDVGSESVQANQTVQKGRRSMGCKGVAYLLELWLTEPLTESAKDEKLGLTDSSTGDRGAEEENYRFEGDQKTLQPQWSEREEKGRTLCVRVLHLDVPGKRKASMRTSRAPV